MCPTIAGSGVFNRFTWAWVVRCGGYGTGCKTGWQASPSFAVLGDGECDEGSVWEAALLPTITDSRT